MIKFVLYFACVGVATSAVFRIVESRHVDYRNARIALANGDHRTAADLFAKAVDGGIKTTAAFAGLGEAKAAVGDYEGARAALERAIEMEPDKSEAAERLAGVYQSMQQPDAAIDLLEKRAAQPNARVAPESALQLARLYKQTLKYESAEKWFAQLPTNLSADPTVQRERAEMLAWQGRYDEAIRMLEETLRRAPDDGQARMELARVLSWAGRLDESREQYRLLLK